ncbi:MAG TPA: ATP-binding protein [Chloroflexota bacterium]|nr:ATP-binding protein [Chloroflexota bacterium]
MSGSTAAVCDSSEPAACQPGADVLAALERLDRLVKRAIVARDDLQAVLPADDRWDDSSDGELTRLLGRPVGAPAFGLAADELGKLAPPLTDLDSPLAWLGRAFELSAFDLDLLVVALAPEVDLRYELIYARLQDDATLRRPTVSLALDLLCASAGEKLTRRAHLGPSAALVRHGLLHVEADPQQPRTPLLGHLLRVDAQTVRVLLGQDGLDPRLTSWCRLDAPSRRLADLPLEPALAHGLETLAARARASHQPLRLAFHGPTGTGKREAAEGLAGSLALPLLTADLARAPADGLEFDGALRLLQREAWFQNAVLCLRGLPALAGDAQGREQCLIERLAADAGLTILIGQAPPPPAVAGALELTAVAFALPGFARRRACWQTSLAATGARLDPAGLDALASRFRLAPRQIGAAAVTARAQARWDRAAQPSAGGRPPGGADATLDDLFAAARAQSAHRLDAVARKLTPHYAWRDLVLPAEALAQLREIVASVKLRHVVYDAWGFAAKLSLGKGVNVLFAGPSGTGKTMAAEVIAHELGLDLYQIDLSRVVSKYVGETEKNLDRVFAEAETSNAILFFDEADALFGKRSEVKDAHDRYANVETGYLLQKMEAYEGVAILATNLRANLDEAFARRMHYSVEFPFPDEAHRYRIWQGIFPPAAPLAADVDLATLATSFRLSGGHIKNAAVAAAFLAADEGTPIGMAHLVRAAKRELLKVGRASDDAGGR